MFIRLKSLGFCISSLGKIKVVMVSNKNLTYLEKYLILGFAKSAILRRNFKKQYVLLEVFISQ